MDDKKIQIEINGKQVTTSSGNNILQAALDSGIYVPYLCYYPGMKPYGACRTCLVEVEENGRSRIVTSCTVPCSEGLKVKTDALLAEETRRGIVELLMSEHPHACLTCHRIELCGPQDVCQRHVAVTDRCTTCPKNERCELKDTARFVELDLTIPVQYHRRNLPIETADPFYDRDYNLCIVCARCVRVCDEVRGDSALTLTNRSGVALVGTSHGVSLLESGCEFCGACIDVCPTGALVERDYKWEKAAREDDATCVNCPLACGMVAEVNKFDKIVRLRGNLQDATGKGQLCFKGKFGYDYVNNGKRLKRVFSVNNGEYTTVDYDTAIKEIEFKLAKYKPEEIAVITSPRAINEAHFVAQRYAREKLHTNNIMSGLDEIDTMFLKLQEYGEPAFSSKPIWDIKNSDLILIINANITEEQNLLGVPVKQAIKNGTELFIVDSRQTELTRYIKNSWIKIRPRTTVATIAYLVSQISESFKKTGAKVKFHLPENQIETIFKIAEKIQKSKNISLIWSVEGNNKMEQIAETETMVSLIKELRKKANLINIPVYRGANSLGARFAGCSPHTEPGGGIVQSMETASSITLRHEFKTYLDIVESIENRDIKAAVVMLDGLPENERLAKSLRQLEFLVAGSTIKSTITDHADFVLPLKVFSEVSGTVINIEGRIKTINKFVESKKGTQISELDIFTSLLNKGDQLESVEKFGKILNANTTKDKFIVESLVEQPNGVIDKLHEVVFKYANESGKKASHSLLFVPGRTLFSENGQNVENKEGKNSVITKPEISIHQKDADRIGVREGEEIKIRDGNGFALQGVCKINQLYDGVVSTLLTFGEWMTEIEADTKIDKMSNLEELRVREVKIFKVGVKN